MAAGVVDPSETRLKAKSNRIIGAINKDDHGIIMAVKIDFFSVIVPVRAIEERFRGGMAGFGKVFGEPANDGRLLRMGAMNQIDLPEIIHAIERGRLKGTCHMDGRGHWLDFCVVDRFQGPTLPCSWLKVDLKKDEVEFQAR